MTDVSKRYLEINVFDAAKERIRKIIREFPRFYVSFSGGKDSSALVHLTLQVAKEENRLPVHLLTIDLEAQYRATIEYIESIAQRKDVVIHWVCLPLHLRNAVSQFQPHWLCWDPDKRDAWVREFPDYPGVIKDENFYPFFRRGMEFEEFVPKFGEWFSQGEKTACMVGIRSDESLNRWRTIKSKTKETYQGHGWTTKLSETLYNAYPIYDWRTEDDWIAHGKNNWSYNRIYDLMHLAGVTIHQARLCQPYGDDQRKGLWLFKILEPETWGKVVARVEGANFGNRYAGTKALGHIQVELPKGYTWRSYAKFLLKTMPPFTADHYKKKIIVFLRYWRKNGRSMGFPTIPDSADSKLEAAKKAPSWRRICKMLIKNDYWCKTLSFSQTKREMERQLALVAKYMEEL